MKMIILSAGLLFSLHSFSEVVCGEAKTFLPGPDTTTTWKKSDESTVERARKLLNKKIANSISTGKTGVFNGKAIFMNKKSISKPSVEITIADMSAEQCIDSWIDDMGKCEVAAICVNVEMDYTTCSPTKYDENTGKRYAICPNGQRVDY